MQKRKKLKNALIGLIVPAAILLLWELSVRGGWIPQALIASPSQVFASFQNFIGNGSIFEHSGVSLIRLFIGFFSGSIAGLIVGIGVGLLKSLDKLISPLFQFLAPIPPIVWIPLFIIFFGIGEASKIVLLSVASFFVLFINTVQGIRSVDEKFIDLAKIYQKSDFHLIRTVLIPSALPNIFIGLRLALGLSWILLIAAEVVASSEGLGWLIWDSRNFSRPDDMFVGIITIGLLGKITDQILLRIEKHFTAWRQTFSGK
jgi:sulfonate transport system permease protein